MNAGRPGDGDSLCAAPTGRRRRAPLVASAGTLYGILDRLVAAGYAEGSGEVVVDGRLRRYYRLTPEGHDALTAETARLSALARRADRLLGGVTRPGIA
ncbi:PadR family transcriptional regulator [Cellulomonas sp. GbtcB1]|uniref:PadR family transcriptional regulator n=1 Tax=Cellulomonas sp. GbtcB1 TaxID=2824746 RepID=UPI001C311624|nr:helix-turn-helix transcriptional regulator [Cellulomonas sp. GbtcB1]